MLQKGFFILSLSCSGLFVNTSTAGVVVGFSFLNLRRLRKQVKLTSIVRLVAEAIYGRFKSKYKTPRQKAITQCFYRFPVIKKNESHIFDNA